MKKILSCLLAAVMLAGMSVQMGAAAEDTSEYEKKLEKLAAFSVVIEGKEKDEEVTRAEFVLRLIELFDINYESYSVQTGFSDVDENHVWAKQINAVKSIGYVTGYSDGTFCPDSPMEYNQAVKVLVTGMGYEQDSEIAGGYPGGYLQTADRIDLTKNVKAGKLLTYDTLTDLLYNALYCDIQTVKMTGSGATINPEDADVMWEYHRIKEVKAVIRANEVTGLMKKEAQTTAGYVTLGKETLDAGLTDAADYLGYSVVAYVYYDEDDFGTIKYVEPDKKNIVHTVLPENILSDDPSFSYYNFVWENENGRRKTVEITDDVSVIYNGVAKPDYGVGTISPELGEVVLIDNNGDGKTDCMRIFAATKRIVAESISTSDKATVLHDKIDSSLSYTYDADYEFYSVYVNGEKSTYGAITADMLVLIGENGTHSETRAYSGYVEATVTALSDEEITLDGEEYSLPKSLKRTGLKLNKSGNFWVWNGYLVNFKIKNTGEFSYGYFTKGYIYENDYGEEVFSLEIMTTEGEFERFHTTEDTKYNGKKEKTIAAAAKLFQQKTAAKTEREKLQTKGYEQFSEDLNNDGWIEQVVMYSQNEDGTLRQIYTQASDDELRYEGCFKRDNRSYAFYADTWMNFYYQNSDTVVFYVPASGDYKDSYVGKLATHEAILEEYVHEFYNVSEDDNAVDIVVWRKEGLQGAERQYVKGFPWPMIVTSVTKGLNDDDEEIMIVKGEAAGSNMELEWNDKLSDTLKNVLRSVKAGDILYWEKDAAGKLTNLTISFDIDKKDVFGIVNQQNFDYVHGTWNNTVHMDRKSTYYQITKKLPENFYRYVDGDGRECLQKVASDTKFYKMTKSGKKVKVEPISYSDVQTGDKIFCYMSYNAIKEMVVIDVD